MTDSGRTTLIFSICQALGLLAIFAGGMWTQSMVVFFCAANLVFVWGVYRRLRFRRPDYSHLTVAGVSAMGVLACVSGMGICLSGAVAFSVALLVYGVGMLALR